MKHPTLKRVADVAGTGWKGYLAGFGLIFYAIALGIDSIGIDIGGLDGTWDRAVELFLFGLAALGIRSRQDDVNPPLFTNQTK